MNDARLTELREKYKDRNLLEELDWGTYANHGGYTNKWDAEFLNWLCDAAYRAIKENKPSGKWVEYENSHCECPFCHTEFSYYDNETNLFNYCPNCGADMRESEDNK